MPNPVRILVVDDSVVIRQVLKAFLCQAPDIDVVGVAANGRIALQKLAIEQVDMVLLDVEMPVMDGLETLREIRSHYPAVKVVMFSGQSEANAQATMEAMSLGATDYVSKPSTLTKEGGGVEALKAKLLPVIKMICGGEQSTPEVVQPPPALPSVRPREKTKRVERIDIVAIGASTGGPNALADVVAHFGPDFPVPIVIVQHMPPVFTRHFAERLDRISGLNFAEASGGEYLNPGHAWVAPGDFHMVLKNSDGQVMLTTNKASKENSCRPAVDPLMRSVAEIYGPHALAVILTGMGSDGCLGCGTIDEHGGRVLAQDEQSSVVWGMPGYVARAGLAEAVLPLDRIGPTIIQWVEKSRALKADGGRR